jgi:hypothetical protein
MGSRYTKIYSYTQCRGSVVRLTLGGQRRHTLCGGWGSRHFGETGTPGSLSVGDSSLEKAGSTSLPGETQIRVL